MPSMPWVDYHYPSLCYHLPPSYLVYYSLARRSHVSVTQYSYKYRVYYLYKFIPFLHLCNRPFYICPRVYIYNYPEWLLQRKGFYVLKVSLKNQPRTPMMLTNTTLHVCGKVYIDIFHNIHHNSLGVFKGKNLVIYTLIQLENYTLLFWILSYPNNSLLRKGKAHKQTKNYQNPQEHGPPPPLQNTLLPMRALETLQS